MLAETKWSRPGVLGQAIRLKTNFNSNQVLALCWARSRCCAREDAELIFLKKTTKFFHNTFSSNLFPHAVQLCGICGHSEPSFSTSFQDWLRVHPHGRRWVFFDVFAKNIPDAIFQACQASENPPSSTVFSWPMSPARRARRPSSMVC